MNKTQRNAFLVRCPLCGAKPGQPCKALLAHWNDGTFGPHRQRYVEARNHADPTRRGPKS